MKKILITGITGFVGNHLTELLKDLQYQIYGTSLSIEKKEQNLQVFKVNLLEEDGISQVISEVKPDEIIHLAALTAPGKSYENPGEFLRNNTEAQLNLLEAVRSAQINPRILIISSAEIYGSIHQEELPLDENTPFNPVSPYAVSKVTQDVLGQMYHNAYNLDTIRVRPFNHTGPGQNENFVVSAFAKQIALIEKGKQEPILKVGNLDSKRDFTDVRDIVKAYMLLLEKGKMGEAYNIGSGKSYKIQYILDTLLSFSDKRIEVGKDPSKMRPSDTPDIVCNPTKIQNATGWKTEIQIEKTLEDTLDYWRGIV